MKKYIQLNFTLAEYGVNCLPSVPAWYIYNIPNACQHLIFKCQSLNSLFCKINFLELPKCYWNVQMFSIIEKSKNWTILLKNSCEIGLLFGMLAPQIKKLACFWHIGMPNWKIIMTLACWYVKMRSWHAFGML